MELLEQVREGFSVPYYGVLRQLENFAKIVEYLALLFHLH